MGEKVRGAACTLAALLVMALSIVPPVSGLVWFTLWCWKGIAETLA